MAVPPLLDQNQFDQYAAAWSQYVSLHQDLTAVFKQPDGSPLQIMQFPFETIEYLLSTVGAQYINARFLLKKDDKSGKELFSLVLYATDAMNGRISAYYLAQYMPPTFTLASKIPEKTDTFGHLNDTLTSEATGTAVQVRIVDQVDTLGDQIPNELVRTWLNNWKQASAIDTNMFSTNYGPLLGYNFGISDFLNSFFYASPSQQKELLLLFGLHQHYPAFPNCHTLKQTFGLVLRIHQLPSTSSEHNVDFATTRETCLKTISATTNHIELRKALQTQAAVAGQPFYDFSQPSPPN